MLDILKSAASVVEVILGLGLLIFIHEFGHFLMAKRHKVRVEAFSLGFGPAIWKRRRGDTEYRISWIPLGGYVKMAGEGFGTGTGKPDELTSKTAWQRFQIFVAGALMNLLIAFPLGILHFAVGKYEFSPEVGVPGTPETYGLMRPGDIVVEVDGVRIESGDHYRIEIIRKPRGSAVPVKVLREGKEVMLTVVQSGSKSHRTLPPRTRLAVVAPGSDLDKAGLKVGDEVVAINGKAVYAGQQLVEMLRELAGQEAKLKVRRRPEEADAFEVLERSFVVPSKRVRRLPDDANLIQPIVDAVEEGDPAHGSLIKDDVIRKIDGREIRSYQDLKEVVEPSVGRVLQVEVERGGEMKTFPIRPTYGESGRGKLGVGLRGSKTFASVPEGSYYHQQGLRTGDLLLTIEGKVGEISVKDLIQMVPVAGKSTVSVEVQRGDQKIGLELTPPEKPECDFAALGVEAKEGKLAFDFPRIFRRRSVGQSLEEGMKLPVDIGWLTYQLLYKLISAEESPKGLAGPLGIFDVSYESAKMSFGNFLWLLVLITVNLGIFNLLPIPILDGGHVVLLAIEKIRGKPPGERFVAIFQYVGLIFLLALIVFVTYNDIVRFAAR